MKGWAQVLTIPVTHHIPSRRSNDKFYDYIEICNITLIQAQVKFTFEIKTDRTKTQHA